MLDFELRDVFENRDENVSENDNGIKVNPENNKVINEMNKEESFNENPNKI